MSEEYGTILDVDTSDAIEPQAVEEGEYKIRITGFRKDSDGNIVRTSDSGFKYFLVVYDIPEVAASKNFSQIFSVPTDSMEPKQLNGAKWALESFKRCFGVSEINFDAMIGREGYALLGLKDDPEYGEQNVVKKLVVPA
jgi:hypothetical protein